MTVMPRMMSSLPVRAVRSFSKAHGMPSPSRGISPVFRYLSSSSTSSSPSSIPGSSRQSHSVAQPSDGPTAYEDAPAPPYISPATSSKFSSTDPSQPSSSSSSNTSSVPGSSPSSSGSSDILQSETAGSPSLLPSSTTSPTSASASASASQGGLGDIKGKGKAGESEGGAKKPAPRRMALRPQKSAITMTPSAVSHLRSLIASPTEPKLLRIGVKSRGCAGMAYHLDYVPPPGGKFDEVVEQDGVKVLIDSKALFSIIGSRMDWRDNRLSAGFVFDNPNVVDTCGCGESFNIR